MKQQDLDNILRKVADLQVFCEYGQRTLPILDEISSFMRQISSAVEDLNAVIEVAIVNIPKAAGQLDRVTQATTQASHDILNILDRMVGTLDEVVTVVSSGMMEKDLNDATTKMSGVVKMLVEKSGWDEDIVRLAETWESHLQHLRMTGPTNNLERLLKDLQTDCTEIMMALQLEDITQQHIGAVMGTIDGVAEGLRKLTVGFFETAETRELPVSTPLPPDPELVGERERKKMVEALLEKARTGEL
jgi:chemotaxis regulatin CheY-phosphate phosphatase CheZ